MMKNIREISNKVFTLVELLVVIAIISILASMLLPALENAREQSIIVDCLSKLRTISNVNIMYANEYEDFSAGYEQRSGYIMLGRWVHPQLQDAGGVEDNQAFKCLSDETYYEKVKPWGSSYSTSYSWRVKPGNQVNIYKINSISNPSAYALVADVAGIKMTYETQLWHNNGYNIGFLDGHVQIVEASPTGTQFLSRTDF